MPAPNPTTLIAKKGIIASSGRPSNPIAIIPITTDMTIKAKPMLCLFNKLLNHLFLILISNCGPRFAY